MIQATDDLIVSVTIPEYAIQKVQVGLAASITSDASPTALRGERYPASPHCRVFRRGRHFGGLFSDIAIQDPENIFIGAKAKAEIILNQKKDVYTVPLDAVQPDGDGMDVIQVRQPDGRFAPVRVQTGMKKRLRGGDQRRGTNVSGGQKQRLCIARALLKSPRC